EKGARANYQAATRYRPIRGQSKIAHIAGKRTRGECDRDMRQVKARAIGKEKSRLLQVGWCGWHRHECTADQRHHGTGLAERDTGVAAKYFDPLRVKGGDQHLKRGRGGVRYCDIPRRRILFRRVECEDLRGHEITALGLQPDLKALDKPGVARLGLPSLSRYQPL